MPQDPFAGESGLLERALLRDVLDVGAGLDPLDIEKAEEERGKQPLRLSAVAVTARIGDQREPEVERLRPVARAVGHGVPTDIADELAVVEPLDQELTFLEADEPAPLGQRFRERSVCTSEVVELAHRRRVGGALVDEWRVSQGRFAEPDGRARLRDGPIEG